MKLTVLVILLLSAAAVFGQLRSLMTSNNGVVISPTNFFYTNFTAGANVTLTPTFNGITIAASGGGGGASLLLEDSTALLLE